MKRAFTLIELLMVIAIIAILASVITVSLNASKNRAITASLRSSLQSIHATAVQCRDIGASLNTGPFPVNSGTPICQSSLIVGNLPQSDECGSGAANTRYTITNSGTDNWQLTLSTCTASTLCNGAANAYCNINGCVFPAAGTCK
ncbi:MAG TPA: hypothetical protein DD454_04055 [Candidatus Moranbacteria bacterium]|nr:hypothetical protein [Candidatus Moranbacteria bacterium]